LFGVTIIGMCGGFAWISVKNMVSYAKPHSTWPLIGSHSAEHTWERYLFIILDNVPINVSVTTELIYFRSVFLKKIHSWS